MNTTLFRSRTNRMIGGVCGGLAERLGIDVTLLRILWAIAVFMFGTGALIYLIAWIVMPEAPY